MKERVRYLCILGSHHQDVSQATSLLPNTMSTPAEEDHPPIKFTPISTPFLTPASHHPDFTQRTLRSQSLRSASLAISKKLPILSAALRMSPKRGLISSSPTDEPLMKRQATMAEPNSISVIGSPYPIKIYEEGGPVGSDIITSRQHAPTQKSFRDWPVYYQPFDWTAFDPKDMTTAPPLNVRLTDHLMQEVIERIGPADRANRYKADFDSAGAPRSIRISLGPAAKLRLGTAEGTREAGWYNRVWRLQYEFIREAGAHAGQIALRRRGTEKKATRSKGSDWSLGSMSVIQGNPRDDYHVAGTLLPKLNPEGSESMIPHDVRSSTSVGFMTPPIGSDSPVRVAKTDRALPGTGLGGRDSQEKRIIRTIVGEEMAKMENQLERTSYQLLAVIEALERPPTE